MVKNSREVTPVTNCAGYCASSLLGILGYPSAATPSTTALYPDDPKDDKSKKLRIRKQNKL